MLTTKGVDTDFKYLKVRKTGKEFKIFENEHFNLLKLVVYYFINTINISTSLVHLYLNLRTIENRTTRSISRIEKGILFSSVAQVSS